MRLNHLSTPTFWKSQTCSFSVMVCSLVSRLLQARRHYNALSVDRDISITTSCYLNERKPSNMENFILTLLICLTSIPSICFSLGCYNCVTRNKWVYLFYLLYCVIIARSVQSCEDSPFSVKFAEAAGHKNQHCMVSTGKVGWVWTLNSRGIFR